MVPLIISWAILQQLLVKATGLLFQSSQSVDDWIGSRENLQETIDFPIKYGAFL
jgi:hypothetical protein